MRKAAAGALPIPKTMVHSAREGLLAEWTLFPCVVKVGTGSHGKGVIIIETASQLRALVDLMKTLDPKRTFLVQECMRRGRDLRVLVIGGKAIGAMLRTAKDGDDRSGISAGGTGEPFPLTPDIVQLSEKISKLIGLEIAGVDLLFGPDNTMRICEINSAPGFRGFETYCGVDVAGEIAHFVEEQLKQTQPVLAPLAST
jgi:RimK family alpha-L-glutamate ligase